MWMFYKYCYYRYYKIFQSLKLGRTNFADLMLAFTFIADIQAIELFVLEFGFNLEPQSPILFVLGSVLLTIFNYWYFTVKNIPRHFKEYFQEQEKYKSFFWFQIGFYILPFLWIILTVVISPILYGILK